MLQEDVERLQRCLGSSSGAWQPPPPGPGSPRPPRTPWALGAWHCQETLGGGRGGRSPLFGFLLPPHDSGRQRLVCISGCSLGASAGSSPAHTAPARQEEQQQHPGLDPASLSPSVPNPRAGKAAIPLATGMGGTAPRCPLNGEGLMHPQPHGKAGGGACTAPGPSPKPFALAELPRWPHSCTPSCLHPR